MLKSYPGAPEDHSVRLNVNLNQFDCNGDGVKDYICQTENGLWYSIWKEDKNCPENWGEWNRQPATCSRFFRKFSSFFFVMTRQPNVISATNRIFEKNKKSQISAIFDIFFFF